ncbi:MAG: hypothetical protein JSV80_10885, partial [Acidobacteriota bacterium]
RWRPQNIDGSYRGEVTLRAALEDSLNVPFAWLGQQLGAESVARWARRAGIDSTLPTTPSLALGTGEVTPLELAAAFASLAAGGQRQRPRLVRAASAAGAEIPLTSVAPPERALPANEAHLVLDALTGVVERGTARALAPLTAGRRVAAKTGTSQNGRDGWCALLTGDAVAVVWVGRDDGRPARLSGSRAGVPVLRELIRLTGESLIGSLPEPPESLVRVEIDPQTGGIATRRCPERVSELYPRERVPGVCPDHRSFWQRVWSRWKVKEGETGRRSPRARRDRRGELPEVPERR